MNSLIYTDQMGRKIVLEQQPKRIVSLVPSQTELLFDLGLDEEVVGITRFCIHPHHQFKAKTRVGGTKQLYLDRIRALKPDLIIANKEENNKEQILELANDFPVWISDIIDLTDALKMIESIGQLVQREAEAITLAREIAIAFTQLQPQPLAALPSAVYVIWQNPWMVAASDTFIHNMLPYAGFRNYFADQQRYPEINLSDLENRPPDVILLSSEPFPFKQKHQAALQKQFLNTTIVLADGELFSWYGSRLLHAAAYFRNLRAKFSIYQ